MHKTESTIIQFSKIENHRVPIYNLQIEKATDAIAQSSIPMPQAYGQQADEAVSSKPSPSTLPWPHQYTCITYAHELTLQTQAWHGWHIDRWFAKPETWNSSALKLSPLIFELSMSFCWPELPCRVCVWLFVLKIFLAFPHFHSCRTASKAHQFIPKYIHIPISIRRMLLREGNFSSTWCHVPMCCLLSFCDSRAAVEKGRDVLCVCFMVFPICIGTRNQGLKWATSARTLLICLRA